MSAQRLDLGVPAPRLRPATPFFDPPGDNEETGPKLDPREIARLIWRHKWGVGAMGLAFLLAGTFYAHRLQPIYQANARLLVEPSQPRYASLEQSFQWPVMVSLFYQTQIEIIRSRALVERVVEHLKLAPAPTAVPLDTAELASWGNLWGLDFRAWFPAEWLVSVAAVTLDPKLQMIEAVRAGVSVTGGDKSQILEISYLAGDPTLAMQVVNTITDTYIAFTLEAQASTAQEATQWLGARLTDLRQKLATAEATLQNYQTKAGLVDTQRQDALQNERLNTLSQQLMMAQTERARVQIRYDQVKKLQANTQNHDLADLLNDPALTALKLELLKAGGKVTELASVYGDKHPKLIAALSELQALEQRFKREVASTVERMRKETEIAASQEREQLRLIEGQKSAIRGGRGEAVELTKLEREVETTRQLYDTFLTRFKQLDTTADNIVPNVRILDRAQQPNIPASPDRQKIMFTAGVLGLVVGVLLALLRERLNNTFRAAEDIEQQLDLPVLSVLPLQATQKKDDPILERMVLARGGSQFAETVHAARTAIQYAHVDQPPQVMLITSSFPGEGKTTLASNLALSLSQLAPTLLIDADLRRPRLSKTLNANLRLGLADLAAGRAEMAEVIVPDPEVPQLALLGAGTRPPNPLDLLASTRLTEVMRTLRQRYTYIVLDAPPILQVSDAVVLAHLADGVILVVKAESTTHAAARDALKRLLGARASLLGAVLSQLNLRRAQRYYGYGYGRYRYYYGHYGNYGADSKS